MSDTKWADVAHYYLQSPIFLRDDDGNEYDRGVAVSYNRYYRCTPILRDIADMLPDFYDRTPSDEEDATADRICATLWDIAFPDSKEDRSCGVFEQKQNGMWMLRYGSERLFLHECGEMFADGGNGLIPFNAADMVHFLTSEGFDIFGLIKSGQAIRKETGNGL